MQRPDREPKAQTRPQAGGRRYQTESERREARRQRARKRKRVRNIFLGVAAGVIAILLIGSISASSFLNFLPTRGGGGNRDEGPGQHFDILGSEHIPANVDYQDYSSNPPTSGPHYATPADWGVYSEEVKPGNFIHSMEHSGVIVHYNTEDSEAIQRLEGILRDQRGFPCYLLLHPNPNIEQDAIALTAWGALDQMPLTELNDERIVEFLEFYRNLPLERHPSVPCDPANYNV